MLDHSSSATLEGYSGMRKREAMLCFPRSTRFCQPVRISISQDRTLSVLGDSQHHSKHRPYISGQIGSRSSFSSRMLGL